LGATVIATVGSRGKVEIARAAGADHVILYRETDFAAEMSALTEEEGVAAAYDAVGRDTFTGSLASLGYLGMLVNYGQASGPVEPFSPSVLAAKSNAVARPILFHYLPAAMILKPWRGRRSPSSRLEFSSPTSFCACRSRRRPRRIARSREEAPRGPSSLSRAVRRKQ
jgi:NADPH2:quinone reductase